jgi:VanZ family protein
MKYKFMLPSLVWSITLLYVTLIPGKDVPSVTISDKVIHFGVFAGLIILTYYGLKKEGISNPFIKAILYSTTLAILTETLQLFIPGRNFSSLDLLANAAGVFIPAGIIKLL